MISSYSSPRAFGHKLLRDVGAFKGQVVVQEKVDGSQISFGIVDGELFIRSRGQHLNLDAPDGMFKKAVEEITARKHLLVDGWIYRGEYLQKEKHNALKYNRTPKGFIALFDIDTNPDGCNYESPAVLELEAKTLGFDCVPCFHYGEMKDYEELKKYLEKESFLGGPKIEGIVIKDYSVFTKGDKAAMAKIVSDSFKEVQKGCKDRNPGKKDLIENLIEMLRTEARWSKAIQHLKEAGNLTETPKDIGPLIKEVQNDIFEEEKELITKTLWAYAKEKVGRGVINGLPQWYKEQLAKGDL